MEEINFIANNARLITRVSHYLITFEYFKIKMRLQFYYNKSYVNLFKFDLFMTVVTDECSLSRATTQNQF